MTRAARPALTVDVMVGSELWKGAGKLQAAVRRAVTRAAAILSTRDAELAIVLTDDSTIRALNRDWRGVDKATNVLAFPTKNAAAGHLGDIVLAFETIAREAGSERKPLAHHLAHLAVHGFLHLVGYDHERPKEALAMERAERKILCQLAIPDPYRPVRAPRRTGVKRANKPTAKRPQKSA
ncbi:MAG: rRNA maturation RNase YbeY [Xanthobacteraceae bacterium]